MFSSKDAQMLGIASPKYLLSYSALSTMQVSLKRCLQVCINKDKDIL
jgi:hypothetical protein